MCRLAAYTGPSVSLEQFLLAPGHGLMEQSWEPREMRVGKLNADGYGFGWFAPDGQPAVYTYLMPIWTDPNLTSLARSLSATQWLANVRSATRQTDVVHANTPPFTDDEFVFLHNGYVADFAVGLRSHMRAALYPEFEAGIHGGSDSEYLFALLRQILTSDTEMPVDEGFLRLFETLTDWLGETPALLNFILGDGERLFAVRHAINGECPSLYYTQDDEAYPEGQLVASEPLTESGVWQAVPEHHLVILSPGEPIQFQPL